MKKKHLQISFHEFFFKKKAQQQLVMLKFLPNKTKTKYPTTLHSIIGNIQGKYKNRVEND